MFSVQLVHGCAVFLARLLRCLVLGLLVADSGNVSLLLEVVASCGLETAGSMGVGCTTAKAWLWVSGRLSSGCGWLRGGGLGMMVLGSRVGAVQFLFGAVQFMCGASI